MEHNCHVEPRERKFATAEYQKTDVALLAVSGMGCPTCAARVRNGLISLYGVTDVTVNHITGWARIVFNPDLVAGIDRGSGPVWKRNRTHLSCYALRI
jgi:copper chaperone CopZ